MFINKKTKSMNKQIHIKNMPLIVTILLLFQASIMQAQKIWDLPTCIHYAIENNLDLTLSKNLVSTNSVSLQESRAALLPNLTLGSGLDLNFGRNIDPNDNSVTYDPTYTNNLWVNSSISLFNGFTKQNAIRYNKHLLRASEEDLNHKKNQLIFNVINAYYKVLYSAQLQEVASRQVEVSKLQYKKVSRLVQIGRESHISLYEIESQLATDRLMLVQAENQHIAMLQELKNLLRIGVSDDIQLVDIDLIEKDIILSKTKTSTIKAFPQISAQEERIIANKYKLKRSKGFLYPSLTLSAGYSSGYFDGDNQRYLKQLNNNQNQWMSLNFRLPIFSNYTTRSSIKRAYISLENQNIEKQILSEQLENEIIKSKNDLHAAYNEYLSTKSLVKHSTKNLESAIKRLEKGLISVSEYRIARQNQTKAEADFIKARLEYEIKKHMLRFYENANWNHLNL
jgi:outer membrane protein